MGITMAILAGLYDLVYAGNKVAQVFSVLMLFLFNSWFSVGWLGMTWLYPAEITPLRIRAVRDLATGMNAADFHSLQTVSVQLRIGYLISSS
jgi:hypothetical protein